MAIKQDRIITLIADGLQFAAQLNLIREIARSFADDPRRDAARNSNDPKEVYTLLTSVLSDLITRIESEMPNYKALANFEVERKHFEKYRHVNEETARRLRLYRQQTPTLPKRTVTVQEAIVTAQEPPTSTPIENLTYTSAYDPDETWTSPYGDKWTMQTVAKFIKERGKAPLGWPIGKPLPKAGIG